MAGFARSWEIGRNVVWICGLVILGHVTPIAGIWRVHVISLMADRTIGGNGGMRADKRVNGRMVER